MGGPNPRAAVRQAAPVTAGGGGAGGRSARARLLARSVTREGAAWASRLAPLARAARCVQGGAVGFSACYLELSPDPEFPC